MALLLFVCCSLGMIGYPLQEADTIISDTVNFLNVILLVGWLFTVRSKVPFTSHSSVLSICCNTFFFLLIWCSDLGSGEASNHEKFCLILPVTGLGCGFPLGQELGRLLAATLHHLEVTWYMCLAGWYVLPGIQL